MTAGTVSPYRPDQQTGRDGFVQLLRAEWTKFRTVRGWVIGLVVAVLVMLGLGLFGAGGSSGSCQSTSGGPSRSGQGCFTAPPVGPGGEAVSDSFYFVRQPLSGNGSITVRVTSLTGLVPSGNGPVLGTQPGLVPWAKAGIIIKESTQPGSAYAAMIVTAGHGVRMQDNFTGDTAGQPGAVTASDPRWLRLTRSGDTITGYDSADGTHWTQVGTVALAGLPPAVQAGLFAASPAYQAITQNLGGGEHGTIAPSQDTAVFDHVSLSGTWPAGAWTGDYIGAAYGSGIGGYHQVGGRFTVTGSGDIAPAVPGQAGGEDLTVTVFLVGTFAGLIAVIVVATMFITAEYRRGLIRTTLTASPRRGRVLAAKAIVVGSAAFAAALAGAAAAVIFGTQLARGRVYVFPVPWLTELRMIIGTAALVAVAAVLALAVGIIVRRSAAAVTLVIVAIVVPYLLGVVSVLPAGAADWVLRITPAAAFAVQQAIPQYAQVTALYSPGVGGGGYFPLAPWAGLAVLCGWAAIAVALALVLLRRRDA
ncbi:MAG TPA: ABC transporter permease subunit [Streptosporangiaceae bacterium]|nr:ABC transporter permease subunit [Streptosporangiaceae bacterium]